MRLEGQHLPELFADLDAALVELTVPIGRDGAKWSNGPPGKWTAGQHVDHIAVSLERTAESLEKADRRFRNGSLPPRPRRGLLQAMFVRFVIVRGRLPRGGKTTRAMQPTGSPDPAETLERIKASVALHRAIGEPLDPAQRDRLWVANPFLPRWHYNLPELVRMHAVHARHHARLIQEIMGER